MHFKLLLIGLLIHIGLASSSFNSTHEFLTLKDLVNMLLVDPEYLAMSEIGKKILLNNVNSLLKATHKQHTIEGSKKNVTKRTTAIITKTNERFM